MVTPAVGFRKTEKCEGRIMSDQQYDLFVIGAGSGGVRAARMAAGHGAKVGIAEGWDTGGTCVNRGCVPKKLFFYSSHMHQEFDDASAYGWKFTGWRRFDWKTLVENKDRYIERLNGIYESLLDDSGVTQYKGYAKFTGPHTVEVNGQEITADRILIATGGRPRMPDIPGAEHLISSDEFFHMPKLPKKAVVIGGGYIAVELACALRGWGCDVTVINRSDRLLTAFDRDISAQLKQEMEKQGIKIILGCEPAKVEKNGNMLHLHTNQGTILEGQTILAAIGRTPHSQDLDLDKAGVKTDGNGRIITNKDNETNIPHIYAVGDVTNAHNLTPVATAEGHALADRLYGGKPGRYVEYDHIPTAVFSHPPISTVGMTEEDARTKNIDYQIFKTSFRQLKFTLPNRDEQTFMKLIVDRKTDKLLGVHIMGLNADEMMQVMGTVLKMGGTKADLDRTIGIHPTAAEELVTMRNPAP